MTFKDFQRARAKFGKKVVLEVVPIGNGRSSIRMEHGYAISKWTDTYIVINNGRLLKYQDIARITFLEK